MVEGDETGPPVEVGEEVGDRTPRARLDGIGPDLGQGGQDEPADGQAWVWHDQFDLVTATIEEFPPGVSWSIDAAGSDAGCSISGGVLTCNFGTLAAAASMSGIAPFRSAVASS